MKATVESLKKLLAERILVIDGAMGTMIQRHKLTEKDFRGERFKDYPSRFKRQQRFTFNYSAGNHKGHS